ncbi:thioredoxin-1 [Musca domestica]|uniref:Thioredoxin-1 n=1 Tax=Musca domestica TaxID=7370 RepID=A0A9J7I1C4_MUSDO|nr:thioredoxin-1 [Musca domestica]
MHLSQILQGINTIPIYYFFSDLFWSTNLTMVSIIKNTEDFEKKLANAGDKLVILDFYATWCGPCKEMDPHIRKLTQKYKDQAIVLKINVDKFNEISDYYKVKSMPTFVFIKNKKRLSSFAGADDEMLQQRVEQYVN